MFVYATAQQRRKSFTKFIHNNTQYINSRKVPAYSRFQHHCTINSVFGNISQVGNIPQVGNSFNAMVNINSLNDKENGKCPFSCKKLALHI